MKTTNALSKESSFEKISEYSFSLLLYPFTKNLMFSTEVPPSWVPFLVDEIANGWLLVDGSFWSNIIVLFDPLADKLSGAGWGVAALTSLARVPNVPEESTPATL